MAKRKGDMDWLALESDLRETLREFRCADEATTALDVISHVIARHTGRGEVRPMTEERFLYLRGCFPTLVKDY